MLSTTILSAEKKLGGYATRCAGAIVALLVVLCFSTPAALGGVCTNWQGGSNNWSNSASWHSGIPNSSTTSACIINGTIGTPTTVTLDMSPAVANLTLNPGNTLNFNGGKALSVSGPQIVNAGNITINAGGGNNTSLQLAGSTKLQGGGTVTLNSSDDTGTAYIMGNGFTLTNADNTIQGYGVIGNGSLTVVNGGTIDANVKNQTLLLNGTGGLTNNGTLEASGSTLQVTAPLSNYNAGTSTLTGGTYTVSGKSSAHGNLQIDALGNTGGEIVNNAATILLNGPNSNFVDQSGKDALSNFSNNTAAGSFTIQNDRGLTTPGDFANAGSVTVGELSTLTIGSGTNAYTQSGGLTQGGGTIVGNVTVNGGIITASDLGNPDILTITGNYLQGPDAEMDAYLQGPAAGLGGYSQLDVTGTATLEGTLDVILGPGFDPFVGENFFVVETGGAVDPLSIETSGNTSPSDWELTYNKYCPAGTTGCVDLIYEGPKTVSTPEPSVLLLLFVGMAMMTIVLKYRNTMRSGVK
jgi:hypothetical protein